MSIPSFNIELYTLVIEEVGKKQKIIDNLCHFSRNFFSI